MAGIAPGWVAIENALMAKSNKPLPIFFPILGTAIALVDFVACFLLVSGPALHPRPTEMLLAEVFLIAMAVLRWAIYFRGYVDQQLEKRLPNPDSGNV